LPRAATPRLRPEATAAQSSARWNPSTSATRSTPRETCTRWETGGQSGCSEFTNREKRTNDNIREYFSIYVVMFCTPIPPLSPSSINSENCAQTGDRRELYIKAIKSAAHKYACYKNNIPGNTLLAVIMVRVSIYVM
jgi:hypothetical protein